VTRLRVDDLRAGYSAGADILRGVSAEVAEGELVAVIGPNGAGKSTLLKSIMGAVSIRSGEVRLDGCVVTGAKTHVLARAGLGYVPQQRNVFARMTVEENLRLGLQAPAREARERLERAYAELPLLGERRRRRAGTLSGGQRQLVAMARALIAEPSVLLLDEPSAGLAPASQRAVLARIRKFCATGVSVLMVEQNARQALAIADRAYVLEQGRNALEGTGAQLLADPRVAELYLGGTTERTHDRA
jgi:branched-chain amino acid transport system ATP-binding protein